MFDKHYSVIDDIAARHFYYCYAVINDHRMSSKTFIEGFDINKGLPEQIRISSRNYTIPNCTQDQFGYCSSDCAMLIELDTDTHKRGKIAYIIPNPFAYKSEGLYIGRYENNKRRPTEFKLIEIIPFEHLNFRVLWPKDYKSEDKMTFDKKINRLYKVAVAKAYDLVSNMNHGFLHPNSDEYFGVDKAELDIKIGLKGKSALKKIKELRKSVSLDVGQAKR